MSDILKKIGVVLLKLLGQRTAQRVVLDILQELTKQTDNELDDRIVRIVSAAMENEKDVSEIESLLSSWKTLTDTSDENAR